MDYHYENTKSEHEPSTINMFYSSKNFHITSYLPITATFICPQGDRCGEVRLYSTFSRGAERAPKAPLSLSKVKRLN